MMLLMLLLKARRDLARRVARARARSLLLNPKSFNKKTMPLLRTNLKDLLKKKVRMVRSQSVKEERVEREALSKNLRSFNKMMMKKHQRREVAESQEAQSQLNLRSSNKMTRKHQRRESKEEAQP